MASSWLRKNFPGVNWPTGGSSRVTTYNSPSSSVQSGLQSLVENYNQAYREATQRNQALYNSMLGVVNQTTNQRATDIRSDYAGEQSNALQQLARRGLGNSFTGAAPALNMGFQREQQSSLNRLADEMQKTKLGVMGKFGAEAYPDLSSLQGILTGITSQYGGGQGISSLLTALSGIQY